ncbi:MAG: protease modulator HflC [Arenicellales bacterium]|jgi:membrane protease subunit HflC|nr:HflC protein [Nitrospinota bacterium]MDP6122974.1 protease modulator HflC [Arenicellales bacterium]MDP6289520.1 protease modulator HflC [Arenicellales bacterium]MDP6434598.1 protease modulator HflC [Arenicellales bacterium]MDP6672753.1 protease modulator HflC [Arenicellales bacterium]|tara:strand:+ start:79 stop:957 length:879 start_codon:yes stop_codon:yes gene_type:complete
MSTKSVLGLLVLVITATLLYGSIYTVDEREKALVFRFGEIVRSDDMPGIHLKVPFINNVRYFDARIQTMDAEPELYMTTEKKNLVVDSFVKWRVRNVPKYYVTVGGLPTNTQARLAQRVNDSLRREFGRRNVQEVISGDRAEIMSVVRKAIDDEAKEIGIEVVDVRLKRVDLDPAVSERVYSRMEAERARVAKELRARGAEAAERIRADADRQREITVANAVKDAEILRGEGDAEATAIFADAFSKDSEFYRFYRSINAYQETFREKSDLLVVEPNSEFFRYFKKSDGAIDR